MTPLAFLEVVFVTAVLAVVAYWGANLFLKARASKALMGRPHPFEKISTNTSVPLLVLGDSTAIGIGAGEPQESVPGRLFQALSATYVENHAEIGAGVEDLPNQIAKAKLPRYDTILIMIGGNNILAFDNARWAGRALGEALPSLPDADHVYVMSAGNVGGATLFPHPIRALYTHLTKKYHQEFERVAHAWDATYVNLYEPPARDPFLKEPKRYLAIDGLHPTSEGYALWFEKLKAQM